ncbi:MAG: rhodanese-like domain-containing protein [bacterium]
MLTEKRLRKLEGMVAEITLEELHSKIENGECFHLLEVSNQADFDSGHIQGAIHVSLPAVGEFATAHFKRYEQIVIYGEDAASSVGTVAARTLQGAGFSNVLVLNGGKEAWRTACLPLDGQPKEEKGSP